MISVIAACFRNRTALWAGTALLGAALAHGASAQTLRDNPFDLPAGVQYLSQLKPPPAGLVLQAIVTGKDRQWATINNRNYAEGDEVEGRPLLAIYQDRVLLADGPRRIELVLNRPPFPIRTTRPERPGGP